MTYKLWQDSLHHFPKKSKYTLGSKIDSLFIETVELVYIASTTGREQKLPLVKKADSKLNLLKFFLQISWETKYLENKNYVTISEPINEIGRMLGGWIKQLEKQNPPQKF